MTESRHQADIDTTEDTGPWLFIGAGNMARAIAAGATRAGSVCLEDVAGCDPNAEANPAFPALFKDAEDAAAWLNDRPAAAIMLAVKPQMLGAVKDAWRSLLDSGPPRLVVSMLAGTLIDAVGSALGHRVIRVMPNTPIGLGQGMTAVCAGDNTTDEDRDRVTRLFGSIGRVEQIEEDLMDAFTAVAGSGPAYVFYLAEAMTNAAVRLGFTPEQAQKIVEQTVVGSGLLLSESDEDAASLRTRVTSKGGTTAAATAALDGAGLQAIMDHAMTAARDRGRELGGG